MSEETGKEKEGEEPAVESEAPREGPGADDEETPRGESGSSPEIEEERAAEAELQAELDHLEDEFQSLKDRHLRLAADFENYRKRAQNEMSESWIRAQADLVRRLLESLDDLQRVTSLDPEESTVDTVLEGVELVERKLLAAMKEAGVEVVDPEGETFDPETMEAMMRVPAEDENDEDRVHQVFQKGYTFKGHLVRPARVSVMMNDA